MKIYKIDCTCASATYVNKICDSSKKISKKKFFDNCIIEDVIKLCIREYPQDFTFHYSSKYDTYYYTHSCIEYFYY